MLLIKNLYDTDENVRAVIDYKLKNLGSHASTSPKLEKATKIRHRKLLAVFNKLARAKAGRYFRGRRGYDSRIAWDNSLDWNGFAALSNPPVVAPVEAATSAIDAAIIMAAEMAREEGRREANEDARAVISVLRNQIDALTKAATQLAKRFE